VLTREFITTAASAHKSSAPMVSLAWRFRSNAKFTVVNGRQTVGSVFASRDGIYSAVTSSGALIGLFDSLQAAASALPCEASS
jgi:hypothetical protein